MKKKQQIYVRLLSKPSANVISKFEVTMIKKLVLTFNTNQATKFSLEGGEKVNFH